MDKLADLQSFPQGEDDQGSRPNTPSGDTNNAHASTSASTNSNGNATSQTGTGGHVSGNVSGNVNSRSSGSNNSTL